LKVAVSATPGTTAGFVSQFALVAHRLSFDPSQASLVAFADSDAKGESPAIANMSIALVVDRLDLRAVVVLANCFGETIGSPMKCSELTHDRPRAPNGLRYSSDQLPPVKN
jgi:hypothetical protein